MFRILRLFSLLCVLAMLHLSSWAGPSLNVALYPYVPRPAQFEAALQVLWNRMEPGVKLNFITDQAKWDGGYSTDPSPDLDVFVFDAMYLEYFRAKNWLEPMQQSEINDFVDLVTYARDGVQADGKYWAIPQLGCANILYFRRGDTFLAEARTLKELEGTLGQCTYTGEAPSNMTGLMLDLAGSTTTAAVYLDSLHRRTGNYTPPLTSPLDNQAISDVRRLMQMSSFPNSTANVGPWDRAKWFAQGKARGLMAYTEAMSVMDESFLQTIGIRVMPLSDSRSTRALFYSDVIGVHSSTQARGTRQLAVKLANLLGSREFMELATGPDGSGRNPQYLMAARHSVFQNMGQRFPMYRNMHDLILYNDPVMYKLDAKSRDWMAAMKKNVVKEVQSNYMCPR